ncbi:MAG: 4-(cytidine 5'-diphospho)-2-C-methyl-D-erythritol kinase [Parasporobacterium sp.]|nr:4-(cytidine 5'-diphospho)-2-C-methyl-D-erythritol kinase [Parasporobacterium sp.]
MRTYSRQYSDGNVMIMKTKEIRAYGKVNLGLDITGIRPDGYHLVKMIMQTVDVYDEITVTADGMTEKKDAYSISITCSDPEVPTDERNLAYKAAKLIMDRYELSGKVEISIVKHIPAAAGMAGGSADGAAVITAMDELYELHMDQAEKDSIALKLGADVPFCLRRGTYLSEGIGEILTCVAPIPHCYMVIIKPDFGISALWAYRAYDEYLKEHKDTPDIHPDIDGLISALEKGSIKDMAACMGNVLEPAALAEYPQIARVRNIMTGMGAEAALMSGSGPVVFGIFTDENRADDAFNSFSEDDYGKFKIKF